MLSASLVDTNAGRGSDVNSEGQFKGDGHDAKDLTEIGMGTGAACSSARWPAEAKAF